MNLRDPASPREKVTNQKREQQESRRERRLSFSPAIPLTSGGPSSRPSALHPSLHPSLRPSFRPYGHPFLQPFETLHYGGSCSPDPPVDRRDDDLHARGAQTAATYTSAEAHEARVTTRTSYGVTQTGEIEISHLDRWNHDRLAGIAALARAHALGDAHRLQVVQHEDRRIIEPEILHRL